MTGSEMDPYSAQWLSPFPETAAEPVNNGVVLAAMMLRDVFTAPSPALLKERLNDALRLYKSPAIVKYALGRGADASQHGDAFVELARAGRETLMLALLDGGLDASLHGTWTSSIASRALYAAARAGQAGAVALLLEKISFTAQDFDGIEGATPALQSAIDDAKLRLSFAPAQPGGLAGVAGASGSFNTSAVRGAKNAAPKMRPRLFPFAAKTSA